MKGLLGYRHGGNAQEPQESPTMGGKVLDVNAREFDGGNTATHIAIKDWKRLTCELLLADERVDLHVRNKRGESVLDLLNRMRADSLIRLFFESHVRSTRL